MNFKKALIKNSIAMVLIILAPLNFVYAAKQIQGTVPKVEPLFPAPLNVYPNISNNVQFHDPSHDDRFNTAGKPASSKNDGVGIQSASSTGSDAEVNVSAKTKGPKVWVLFVILGLGVLAFFWLRFKSRKL